MPLPCRPVCAGNLAAGRRRLADVILPLGRRQSSGVHSARTKKGHQGNDARHEQECLCPFAHSPPPLACRPRVASKMRGDTTIAPMAHRGKRAHWIGGPMASHTPDMQTAPECPRPTLASRPTPLAMRCNHLAALGEFLGYSQPWPKLRVWFLLQRLLAETCTLACGTGKPEVLFVFHARSLPPEGPGINVGM